MNGVQNGHVRCLAPSQKRNESVTDRASSLLIGRVTAVPGTVTDVQQTLHRTGVAR
jgi:hypothetical protein